MPQKRKSNSAAQGSPTKAVSDANALQKASEIDDLIAELCVKAPSDAVKFCLRCYQPGKRLPQIEKDIFNSKKEVLVDTCKFLQISHRKSDNKTQLAHNILCRIQNLLPDDCGLCKKRYSVSLGDTPLLECSICGQGVHEICWINLFRSASDVINKDDDIIDRSNVISNYINPYKLPGIFYICPVCEERTIPKEEQHLDATPETSDSGTTLEKPEPTATTEIAENECLLDSATEEKTDHTNEDEVDSTMLEETQTTQLDSCNEDVSDHQQDDVAKTEKSKTVCRFFRRGTCKHGLRGNDCNYSHPKMCSKFLQHGTRQPHGCNRGKSCKQFHPLMCMDSLKKSECLNEKCTYNHIKGTRRLPKLVKNNQLGSKSNQTGTSGQGSNGTPHTKQIQHSTSPISDTEPQTESSTTTNDNHFLEVVRLLKAEIISTMNTQIATLASQIKGIQQVQAQQPTQQIPYYQHTMFPLAQPRMNPQLLVTPQMPQRVLQQHSIQMPATNQPPPTRNPTTMNRMPIAPADHNPHPTIQN